MNDEATSGRVNWSATSSDYGRFRAGFPPELLDRVEGSVGALAGRSVVDLGAGTGTLARQMAQRGASVTAVDVAEGQLAAGRALAAEQGLGGIAWRAAPAEQTGLPGASADLVTAGQAWHWFGRPRAAREALRLLRRPGALLIAHFDFLAREGNEVATTLRVVDRFRASAGPEPHERLCHHGLYPAWLDDCVEAGFVGVESFSFDVAVRYTREAWRGRLRASAWIGGRLPPPGVQAFDEALEAALLDAGAGDAFDVPHRVFAVLARAA